MQRLFRDKTKRDLLRLFPSALIFRQQRIGCECQSRKLWERIRNGRFSRLRELAALTALRASGHGSALLTAVRGDGLACRRLLLLRPLLRNRLTELNRRNHIVRNARICRDGRVDWIRGSVRVRLHVAASAGGTASAAVSATTAAAAAGIVSARLVLVHCDEGDVIVNRGAEVIGLTV